MDPPSFLVFLGINQDIVGYGLSPFCYGCERSHLAAVEVIPLS